MAQPRAGRAHRDECSAKILTINTHPRDSVVVALGVAGCWRRHDPGCAGRHKGHETGREHAAARGPDEVEGHVGYLMGSGERKILAS